MSNERVISETCIRLKRLKTLLQINAGMRTTLLDLYRKQYINYVYKYIVIHR